MSVRRYAPNFKKRTDLIDPITPSTTKVTPIGGIAVPQGEFLPSSWLPVVWKTEKSKDYFTVSSGKIVSFDREGRICLSGYKKVAAAATDVTDPFLTYTAYCVEAKVRDIRTGMFVTAAGVVTIAEAATAILSRGLVKEGELTLVGDDFDAAELADCKAVLAAFISDPVGTAAYDYYAWGGDITNAEEGLNFHNYSKQHMVTFWTESQMQMPVGGLDQKTGVDLSAADAWGGAGTGAEFPDADGNGNVLALTSTQLASLARYSDPQKVSRYITAGMAVVGFALETDGSGSPLAANISTQSPLADANNVLLKEKKEVSSLRRAGDFMLDEEAGILLVFSDWDATGGTPLDIDATDLSYFHYDSAGASSSWKYLSAIGEFKPGDYLTYDAFSNFVPSATKDLGRVLYLVSEPKGLLERVKTGFYSRGEFDATASMPGSATSGLTDLITLSEEAVSNKVLVALVRFI